MAGAFILASTALEGSDIIFRNTGGAGEAALRMSGGISTVYLSEVGGVAFMNTARPDAALDGKAISLLYNGESTNGWRFTATIAGQNAVIRAPDWVIIPAIRFANTEYTGAYTMIGEGRRIHPVLKNTQMGLIACYVDDMLLDPSGLRNDVKVTGDMDDAPFMSAFDSLASSRAAQRIEGVFAKYKWDSYLYTDEDVPEVFSIRDGQLEISGDPYVLVWAAIGERNLRTGDIEKITDWENVEGATAFFRQNPGRLYQLNPAVFQTAREFSHLVSFFRYLKAQQPTEFQRLNEAVRGVHLKDPNSSHNLGYSRRLVNPNSINRDWLHPNQPFNGSPEPKTFNEMLREFELHNRLGNPGAQ